MKYPALASSRLAFRHLLVVVLVTLLFSAATLGYQVQIQYSQGNQAASDVLAMIEDSYLPPLAAGLFYFDDQQLHLLAAGIVLLPYVESVTILERRSGEDIPIITTSDMASQNIATHTYLLLYEHDGTSREIGALQLTTSLDQLHQQILKQLQATAAANLLMILVFAFVILVVVQRMVFRHLRTITAFVHNLDPEHLGSRELVLDRRLRTTRSIDELDEISGGINTMLLRLDRALKEKKLLLQELYHRTGNMLQSIRAILRLQSSGNNDNQVLQTLVRAVDNRILAMALVHRKLYQRGDLSRVDMKEYLGELAQEIFRSYPLEDQQLRLETDIAELSLLIDTAIPCGMVLCELLSNSLQHAFPAGRGGLIQVALHSNGDNQYRLSVADDGIGVGSDFDIHKDGSIGMQSISAIVEMQLKGSIKFYGSAGVQWEICFSDTVYRARVPNE